ncbi:MAG: thiamine phosphate synthase [Hyphomonadaceae bacterium]
MTHQAQDDLLRKLRVSVDAAKRHLAVGLPGLFALTDPVRMPDPIAVANQLFAGCGIIYRHFGADDRLPVARQLAGIAQSRNLTLLIGNDPDLAKQVGADGVHWPEARLKEALKWRTAFDIMTGAAHSPEAINLARTCQLDAALVSAIFPSSSPSAGPPIGVTRFRDWAKAAGLPVYGLGGLTSTNISEIHDFAGSAMIGALEPLQAEAQ